MRTDAELAADYLGRRDEAAFRELVRRHAGPVFRAALAVSGDHQTAEDALQETFLAVMRGLRRYEPGRSFRAWAVGIAVKRASNLARGRRRALRRDEKAGTRKEEGMQPHEAAQRDETNRRVTEAIGSLPEERRLPLLLHYAEGLSHAEIAAALGIPQGTAKSRVARGLEELRDRLGRSGLAVAAPDLARLLAAAPKAEPAAALLEVACAKAVAAGPAAGLLGLKFAAAALLALGAAGGAIHLAGDAEESRVSRAAPASERIARADDAPVAFAPDSGAAEAPGGGAPPAAAQEPSVDAADAPAPGGAAEEGEGPPEGGRILKAADLPEGSVVVKKDGETKELAGGTFVSGGRRIVPAGPARGDGATRFAPLPPYRGDATIEGRVVDAAGRPIAGAPLFRISPKADRSQGTILSFEFLAEVGKSGADGSFRLERHEAGAFFLVADYQRQMLRPRGLETKRAVRVEVAPLGVATGVELVVPIDAAALVPLRGVLTDAAGAPIRGAEVFVDYLEAITDAAGRFDVGRVAPGARLVQATRTGYKPLETTFEVRAGVENVCELRMELAATGSLRLAGRIVDEGGNAVPDAGIYLGRGNGTVRSLRSDADGRFAFETLPDSMLGADASITVWVDGFFPKSLKKVAVPQDSLEIRLERAIRLLVRVVSEATGEPIRQIAGALGRDVLQEDGTVVRRDFRSWSLYSETGTLDDLEAPAERLRLTLEAPGHARVELVLDLRPGEASRELTVALPALPAPGGG